MYLFPNQWVRILSRGKYPKQQKKKLMWTNTYLLRRAFIFNFFHVSLSASCEIYVYKHFCICAWKSWKNLITQRHVIYFITDGSSLECCVNFGPRLFISIWNLTRTFQLIKLYQPVVYFSCITQLILFANTFHSIWASDRSH